MGALSVGLADEYLDFLLRSVALTPVPLVFAALHTAAPTQAAPAELGGARQQVTFDNSDPGGNFLRNTAAVIWSNLSAGTATHVGLWDALTGGRLLYSGPLLAPALISAGGGYAIAIGALQVVMDGPSGTPNGGNLTDWWSRQLLNATFANAPPVTPPGPLSMILQAERDVLTDYHRNVNNQPPGPPGGPYIPQPAVFDAAAAGSAANSQLISFSVDQQIAIGFATLVKTGQTTDGTQQDAAVVWWAPLDQGTLQPTGATVLTFPVGTYVVALT